MKKIFYTLMIALSLTIFSGCGENHNGEVIKSEDMIIGVQYTVNSGDIFSPGENAKIEVIHTLSNGTKVVKLLSGEAKLIRVNS